MPDRAGTDLIGHVVTYVGSISAHHRDKCVVTHYDEGWDRYTLDPLNGGPCVRRISRVRRISFMVTDTVMNVCPCGHAITNNLPRLGECARCSCTTHRAELADDDLFARVATGHEQIIRDDHGNPYAVLVPYDRYLTDRAAAAFHGV